LVDGAQPSERQNIIPKGGAKKERRALTIHEKESRKRWRTGVMAQDFVDSVSRMMVPPVELGRFGYKHEEGR
jgi:hypothetical protein